MIPPPARVAANLLFCSLKTNLDNQVEEIKNRLDVVDIVRSYMKLDKGGVNFRGLCPFHREKTPSFFVSPTRQLWKCFGCSVGGDMFNFIMQIEGVDFPDALKTLADRAGVRLRSYDPKIRSEKTRLYEICERACQFFEKQLSHSSFGREAKEYLTDRGISEESILKFRIGFAPDTRNGLSEFLRNSGYSPNEIFKAGVSIQYDNGIRDRFRSRILFPISDLNSQIIGFGGRIFFGKNQVKNPLLAKYINTPQTLLYDKSKILYGLDKAKMKIREHDSCIVVEGYTDVIMANQAGCENVVSTSGTAFTEHQLDIIHRYTDNLVTSFDMDIAGDTATKRGINLAQQKGFNIKVVTLPEGKDPAEIIQKSEREWKKAVSEPLSIGDFYFQSAFARFDKNNPEGIKNISNVLLPMMGQVPSNIERSYWVQKLAAELKCNENVIWNDLAAMHASSSSNDIDKNNTQPAPRIKETKNFKKLKEDALYEHLLLTALRDSQCLKIIRKKDFQLLDKNSAVSILEKMKKGGASSINLNTLVKEEKDYINELMFQEEILPTFSEEVSMRDEFNLCLRAIKKTSFQKKLFSLQREMKSKNQKNQNEKLLKEFQKISLKLANL